MNKINTIEDYLKHGCGRCRYFATPQCKVNTWRNGLKILRRLVLKTKLNENIKWGMPTYSFNNKNIVMIAAFKNYFSLNFFKGSFLIDQDGIFDPPKNSSNQSRLIKFLTAEEVIKKQEIILKYIQEAIQLEEIGYKIKPSIKSLPEFPQELLDKFLIDPSFKTSFLALSLGRQKSYIYYFKAAKKSITRSQRIENFIAKIKQGKGYFDE